MKRGLWRRLLITIALLLMAGAVVFVVRPMYPPTLSLIPELVPTAEYLEREPQQASELFSVSALQEQRLCVGVNEGELLDFGMTAEELQIHIFSNLNIVVDSHPIERIYLFFSTGGPLNVKYDSQGNFLGIYGYSTACVARNLEYGLHIASVTLPDTAGNVYTHTWAFRIERTQNS